MSSTGDPFGPLAALFTSGSSPQGGTAPAGEAALPFGPVVTVLVGNLPVMAGLWTTQFADEVGRVAGPTALVRFERGEVTVELLRADGRQLPPASPNALGRWLPRGASSMRRWVVCIPAETPAAEVLAGGTEILIMSGADEAAVTGAYLRLKHLADEATHRGTPLERIGAVLVGATPDQAAAAAARLSDAARSFLGIEVEVVARIPRLERVESSARATYPSTDSPSFEGFMRDLARAREDMAHRFDSGDAPAAPPIDLAVQPKQALPPRPAAAAAEPSAPAAPVMPAPVPAAAAHAPAAAHTHTPAQTHAHTQPAHTPPAHAAAASTAALPGKLVPLLRGLRPLGIACPVAHDVELALDDHHRMHIVGRADQLARVRTARHWAHVHRELLGMAFPDLRNGFEVRERLLLADAREAIPLHGTGVLLDLLVTAETPAGRVQVVVPLNDPSTAG
jgi:hypothetical protein